MYFLNQQGTQNNFKKVKYKHLQHIFLNNCSIQTKQVIQQQFKLINRLVVVHNILSLRKLTKTYSLQIRLITLES